MSGTALATWVLVALLGVMTPGADTLLVLRYTLLRGRPAGMATIGGIVTGCLIWATASLAGLTALLTVSHVTYDVVRLLGAAYLVWLGASAIWKTLPRNRTDEQPPSTHERPADRAADGSNRPSRWAGLRAGTLTNLLNPKVGVFYISLLPQFLPTGHSTAAWGSLLVAIHLAVNVLWYPLIVWTATRVRGFLLRAHVRRWMDRLSAAILLGLGITLAAETT